MSTPSLLLLSLRSTGSGIYVSLMPLPLLQASKFVTAEMPPYAHPTTNTRCGVDSDKFASGETGFKTSVTAGSLILAMLTKQEGELG